MNLAEVYNRVVPARVRISSGFDIDIGCQQKTGDVVDVIIPPEYIKEIDNSSLWVGMKYDTGDRPVRLYEHEYEEIK
jgi:hypothetical protein